MRMERKNVVTVGFFSARYEGKVELRAICLNSRGVVHYDTVKSTTCVKEEDETLSEIVFIIIIIIIIIV